MLARIAVIPLLLCCLSASASAQGLGDYLATVEELKALEGKWVAVEGQQAGKELTAEQLAAVHFSAGGFTIELFGSALFQLNARLKQFSFLYGRIGYMAKGRGLGMYQVDGDTLRLAIIDIPPGGMMIRPRPTSFAEALDQAHTVLKLKRSKP